MSKYTPEEPQQMAIAALRAMDNGDKRAAQLLMMLSLVTNTPRDECVARIKELANGTTEDIRSAA
jgi:hypothetical protein